MKTKEVIGMALLGACVGVAIGTTIELVFSLTFAGTSFSPGTPEFLNGFTNSNLAVFVERVVYALYGIICSFAGLLYRDEHRPVALSAAMHFGVVILCGIAAGSYLKWWSSGWGMLGVIVSIVVIYLIIWLVTWLFTKGEVARMNEKLQ
ncbi:MAG: DUF3021 domain-containing protein [Mobiluncus sp.]|uniref:DUF3021 domain-containing protein n=1 Tax=Mobiluncus sp. TaxID=47293 RepID=UPI002584DE8B|nr:DUF3021 domain-containing protein [Mobiluncus sp.]MCI6584828.1 DUF3021 domain-containing protein [Mobiluncus sp.]